MEDRREAVKVERVLERGRKKIEKLHEEREELVNANRRLVELVRKLEAALEENATGTVQFEDSEYSFEDGWQPTDIVHEENLDLGHNFDLGDIDRQVSEVLKSMKRVENLNQE